MDPVKLQDIQTGYMTEKQHPALLELFTAMYLPYGVACSPQSEINNKYQTLYKTSNNDYACILHIDDITTMERYITTTTS